MLPGTTSPAQGAKGDDGTAPGMGGAGGGGAATWDGSRGNGYASGGGGGGGEYGAISVDVYPGKTFTLFVGQGGMGGQPAMGIAPYGGPGGRGADGAIFVYLEPALPSPAIGNMEPDAKRDFGATGSTQSASGTGTAGSTIITNVQQAAPDFEVGQSVKLAAPASVDYAVIQSIQGSTWTLSAPVATSGQVTIAHDDTAALTAWAAAANTAGKGVLPPGQYNVTALPSIDGTVELSDSGAILFLMPSNAATGVPQQRLSYYHPQGEPYNVLTETFASGSSQSTTGSITAGQTTLTVASAIDFQVGQGISVAGAGASGALLVSQIVAISGTTFTLAAAAGTSVSNAAIYHDDTAAIQAAVNAAGSSTTGPTTVLLGPTHIISSTISVPGGIRLAGQGAFVVGATIYTNFVGTAFSVVGQRVTFERLWIRTDTISGASGNGIDAIATSTVNPSWIELNGVEIVAAGICLNLDGSGGASQPGDLRIVNSVFFTSGAANGVALNAKNWRNAFITNSAFYTTGGATASALNTDANCTAWAVVGCALQQCSVAGPGSVVAACVATAVPTVTSSSSKALLLGGIGPLVEFDVLGLPVQPGSGSSTATSAGSTIASGRFSVQLASSTTTYFFEASIYTSASGATAYAGLWDVTAGALVAGSTVSTTNTTGTPVRSGAIQLTAGHVYAAALWTSNSATAAGIQGSRIVGQI